MYKNMLPDWSKFHEVQVGRWAKTLPLQIEYCSLDLAYWEPKEARKFMKFVKAMKPKFNLKVCPIQIKTDKCIFTGEWRPKVASERKKFEPTGGKLHGEGM